jgi:hypothetical protein
MSDPHAAKAAATDDEPKSPMWLPALGAALFVSVGLWWAVTPAPPPPADADQAASASAAASAAPAPTPPPTATPVRPQMPPPTASAAMAPAIPSNLPPGLQQRIQRVRNGGKP